MEERCHFNSLVPCGNVEEKINRGWCRGCTHWQDRACQDKIEMEGSQRHGHSKFYELCEEEMDLYSRKNHDYAKGGNPLGNFQRVAKILSLYPNLNLSNPAAVAIVYLLKQFDASLWILSNGHEPKLEGHKERWQDVSVYSKIISILLTEC